MNQSETKVAGGAQTRVDILTILRASKLKIQREFPVHRMALFGSWARGDYKPDSDVDILVDVDPAIGIRFVTLAEQLEDLLGRDVDLVSQRAIKPSLWQQIESDLIYV